MTARLSSNPYAECPDCGAPTEATLVLGFSCEHERCPMMNYRPAYRQSKARDAASAALAAQAQRTARREIKDRARAYALRPRELDAIMPKLSGVRSPHVLVIVLEGIHRPPDWRFFGFGGEVPALNVRGALLYARYARAKARQLARRAAA